VQIVDARGMPCPQPVVLARRAMREGQVFQVLVDSETSLSNVSRMARAAGWEVGVDKGPEGTRLTLTPPGAKGAMPEAAATAPARQPSTGPVVVLLASDTIGLPDDKLGQILVRSFLHTLRDVESQPDVIICMNGGVRLAAEGSPALDDLRELVDAGIELLLCGTCLDYFGLKPQVGTVSNMYNIAETLLRAAKVVRP